ncbi:unnamed protein product [Cyclocybe aegerita]|uniref:Transmembrane protein n=1 Tax=Cyclocybe aegerita TaxID=1973307 RepID=A0A8S0WTT0_CYCAE|nr:unnamed protein product [Cyclocybe aegerita]
MYDFHETHHADTRPGDDGVPPSSWCEEPTPSPPLSIKAPNCQTRCWRCNMALRFLSFIAGFFLTFVVFEDFTLLDIMDYAEDLATQLKQEIRRCYTLASTLRLSLDPRRMVPVSPSSVDLSRMDIVLAVFLAVQVGYGVVSFALRNGSARSSRTKKSRRNCSGSDYIRCRGRGNGHSCFKSSS